MNKVNIRNFGTGLLRLVVLPIFLAFTLSLECNAQSSHPQKFSLTFFDAGLSGLEFDGALVLIGFGTQPGVNKFRIFQVDTGSPRNLLYRVGQQWGKANSTDLKSVSVSLSNVFAENPESHTFHELEVPANGTVNEGVTGLPFFKNRCATFDFQGRVLVIGKSVESCAVGKPAPDAVFPVTYDDAQNRAFVTVRIGGRALRLIFDTGAASFDVLVFDRVLFESMRTLEVRSFLGTAFGRVQKCDLATTGEFERITSPQLGKEIGYCTHADGPAFARAKFEGADGLLGLQQLKNRRFMLDMINHRLVVWPESKSATTP